MLPELRVIRTGREAGSDVEPVWGYTAHPQTNDPSSITPVIWGGLSPFQKTRFCFILEKSQASTVAPLALSCPVSSGIALDELRCAAGAGHPALAFPQLSLFLCPTWGCEAVHNAINISLMTNCHATNVGRGKSVLRTPGSQTCGTSETEQSGQDGKDGKMQGESQTAEIQISSALPP